MNEQKKCRHQFERLKFNTYGNINIDASEFQTGIFCIRCGIIKIARLVYYTYGNCKWKLYNLTVDVHD
jgi:hypothetical protein